MVLLKNKSLNTAILISTTWHLICMFSIAPVLIPEQIKQNSSSIYFLGSILEKVNMVKEKPIVLDRVSLLEKMDKIVDTSIDLDSQQRTIVSEFIGVQPTKEQFSLSEDEYGNKLRVYHKRESPEIKFPNFLVRGEAKNRMILYKPDLFKIPVIPFDFSCNYSADVKFRISKHGFVEAPECISSSGDPYIDQIAIRYVRRWQFVPYNEGLGPSQEGTVRINFEVK